MKCARCGKSFQVTHAGWGYAYGGMYVCSYSCMRAMEREENGMLSDEQKSQIDQLYASGKGVKEIAEALGAEASYVKSYIATQSLVNKSRTYKKKEAAAPAEEDCRTLVVRLIQDMLDVLKKLYGI